MMRFFRWLGRLFHRRPRNLHELCADKRLTGCVAHLLPIVAAAEAASMAERLAYARPFLKHLRRQLRGARDIDALDHAVAYLTAPNPREVATFKSNSTF